LPIHELDLKHPARSIHLGGRAAASVGLERREHQIDGPRCQAGARSLLRRMCKLIDQATDFSPLHAARFAGDIRHENTGVGAQNTATPTGYARRAPKFQH
jgi:hypothetical protein